MQASQDNKLQLDVDKVLRDKAPKYYRYIPKCLINWLKSTVCQDELNGIMSRNYDKKNIDFASAVIKDLNIKINYKGEENIPSEGRFIFVSNHPLGALDGVALISYLGQRYNGKLRFIVNDILMNITPMADIFLPINKHGKQSKEVVKKIADALDSDYQIASFPAGLCSRKLKGDKIGDLKWQKAFIMKSIESKRDIIPVFFDGRNSDRFYRISKIRHRIGLKINIEMIYLPSEVFKSRNKEYTVYFGTPISWKTFDNTKRPIWWARFVREIAYGLKGK